MKLILAVSVLSVSVLFAQQSTSDTVRNPLAGDSAAVTAGQQVYNQTCQGCHGPAGQGESRRGAEHADIRARQR
jgi:mono/diheme cytochrome c family protein